MGCRTGNVTDTKSTWKCVTSWCYTPRPVSLSVDSHLELHVCCVGARWGSGETRTNTGQHGSSQHPQEVLTLSCEDMSTQQQSGSNSLLLEGHDNRRDTTMALSWLCCDRVGSDDLWRSLPTTVRGDCLGKVKCNDGIMEGTKKALF